jgi:hypothetical protein
LYQPDDSGAKRTDHRFFLGVFHLPYHFLMDHIGGKLYLENMGKAQFHNGADNFLLGRIL